MPDDEQQSEITSEITDDQRDRAVDRLQGHVGTGDLTSTAAPIVRVLALR